MDTHSIGFILLFFCYAGVPAHAFVVAKALQEPTKHKARNKLVLVLMPIGYFLLMCVSALFGTSPESPMMKVLFAVFLVVLASSMHVSFQMQRNG